MGEIQDEDDDNIEDDYPDDMDERVLMHLQQDLINQANRDSNEDYSDDDHIQVEDNNIITSNEESPVKSEPPKQQLSRQDNSNQRVLANTKSGLIPVKHDLKSDDEDPYEESNQFLKDSSRQIHQDKQIIDDDIDDNYDDDIIQNDKDESRREELQSQQFDIQQKSSSIRNNMILNQPSVHSSYSRSKKSETPQQLKQSQTPSMRSNKMEESIRSSRKSGIPKPPKSISHSQSVIEESADANRMKFNPSQHSSKYS